MARIERAAGQGVLSHYGPFGGHKLEMLFSDLDQFIQHKCVENIEQQCKEGEENGQKPKFETILTLDGGGIRGLILAQTLLALERELGEPILKYVDWLAGTSTGAFLAAALAKGNQFEILDLSFSWPIPPRFRQDSSRSPAHVSAIQR